MKAIVEGFKFKKGYDVEEALRGLAAYLEPALKEIIGDGKMTSNANDCTLIIETPLNLLEGEIPVLLYGLFSGLNVRIEAPESKFILDPTTSVHMS